MELKYIVPNAEKTFGDLSFAGESKVETKYGNRSTVVTARIFEVYSTIQRRDNILICLPAEAGEKNFDYEDKIKLINPKLFTAGVNVENQGFTKYILRADDMVKE